MDNNETHFTHFTLVFSLRKYRLIHLMLIKSTLYNNKKYHITNNYTYRKWSIKRRYSNKRRSRISAAPKNLKTLISAAALNRSFTVYNRTLKRWKVCIFDNYRYLCLCHIMQNTFSSHRLLYAAQVRAVILIFWKKYCFYTAFWHALPCKINLQMRHVL